MNNKKRCKKDMESKLYIPCNKIKCKSDPNNIICYSNQNTGGSIFTDFAWFASDEPRIPVSTNSNNPTQVAQVALYGLQVGDEIWLNGLFHMDNNSTTNSIQLSVRIFKNGTQIYNQLLRIDDDQRDDLITVPVQTVDTQSAAGSAFYTLFVNAIAQGTEVFGHRTFTATV